MFSYRWNGYRGRGSRSWRVPWWGGRRWAGRGTFQWYGRSRWWWGSPRRAERGLNSCSRSFSQICRCTCSYSKCSCSYSCCSIDSYINSGSRLLQSSHSMCACILFKLHYILFQILSASFVLGCIGITNILLMWPFIILIDIINVEPWDTPNKFQVRSGNTKRWTEFLFLSFFSLWNTIL